MAQAEKQNGTEGDPFRAEDREMAIAKAFMAVVRDLDPRSLPLLDDIWLMVYARVPCTEAEFRAAVAEVARILECLARSRGTQPPKRARLAIGSDSAEALRGRGAQPGAAHFR